MLNIFGKASSINVRKVLWTCVELNLPFEREDWGSGFRSAQTPEFLALNPNALVPVIKDGDFVLWESNTIIRYLASRYGGAQLYPADAFGRARVDQWIDWQATGAFVAGAQFSLADIPVGLSVNRWFGTPFEHPHLPAVAAYFERLAERPGFAVHCANGTP
ncbi:glutathione S-transferase N-terminal domain-containing protein [Paraburkholderia sp. CNPSo 3076]|uniref:glutathione S-transferase family protein n=1 Tax=Paraburkholderia sp. CNPSo 3076 TaxID=2940936 RepID=UPI002253ACE1|nr:glutathione S-transferase N-terminal domain-containing protein [Paraburkholderia sp. CNPSo 3076]MCX5542719.1 glutathione S-transferase N-terminal domain-containing protein [Paraburkholderia sp. CNPSo 3076]